MNCLPHPNSISKWYRNVNCSFGISDACIEAVKRKVNSQKIINEKADVLCNLVFDEMKIKKKVEVINGKEYGYVDIGKGVEDDNMPAAENALVVMLVCINGSWKIPVSHYFINSLSGKEKATIINEILLKLNETGVTITSITFDGLQSNITMCKELGVTISAENHENAYFLHPVSKKPVFIMPDGCHALKLIRNAFANDIIYDGDGNVISWNILEKLVDVQEHEGLHLGTKIRRDHIQFEQNKMNVRLAAQTLSESCSSALRYMKNSIQNPEFDNVDGTANFCSIINEGFDILNSRERYNKNKCKNGIDEKNIEEIKKKVDKIITYIKGLRSANGTPVVNYPRKTGFVGMIISLQNIVKIYDSFIKPINGYLLTYKLSQDHLENFFSAVRSKGGYSNNPTCFQFIYILKKLLVHADVKESKYANSTSLDTTNILQISLKKDNSKESSTNSIVNSAKFFQTANYISESDDFYGIGKNKKYIDNIVSYIAGFVIRTILKKSRCYTCPLLLTSETNNSSLIETKNRGGLLSASSDVIDICKLVEKNFRLFYTSRKGIFNKLFRSILNNIPDNLLPIKHSEDPIKHRLFLLNQIIFTYLRVRVNHHESQKNQMNKKIRRVYTKLILFRNE